MPVCDIFHIYVQFLNVEIYKVLIGIFHYPYGAEQQNHFQGVETATGHHHPQSPNPISFKTMCYLVSYVFQNAGLLSISLMPFISFTKHNNCVISVQILSDLHVSISRELV